MNDQATLFLIMLICLEIFELFWQRGHNFREYIANLFSFYKKSVLLFIVLHPTLYFSIFSQISFENYSFLASTITLFKAFDLGFKLTLMDRIFHKKELGSFAPLFQSNFAMSPLLKMSGLFLYTSLFTFSYLFSFA